jgi:hypothetical protein
VLAVDAGASEYDVGNDGKDMGEGASRQCQKITGPHFPSLHISGSMFSLLLSDSLLKSSNWLAAAPDPRPDQLPHPVSPLHSCCPAASNAILACLGYCFAHLGLLFPSFRRAAFLLVFLICILVRDLIRAMQGDTNRKTYVGVLTNKRAMLCIFPAAHALAQRPASSALLLHLFPLFPLSLT